MKLHIFRESLEIGLSPLTEVGRKIGQSLGIRPVLFEQPAGDTPITRLHALSGLQEREEQVGLALVFTMEARPEEIAGERHSNDQAAWVEFHSDLNRTVQAALHGIGHACGADHCPDRNCLMFAYSVERQVVGIPMPDLLCTSCREIITGSWIYRELKSDATNINETGEIGYTQKKSHREIKPSVGTSGQEKRKFPDWSLPKTEFLKQVKEFFGYQ